MSDCVDSFSVPPSYDVDFDVPPYWSLACNGTYFAMVKIGILSVVMEYVYLKCREAASVLGGKQMRGTRDMLWCAIAFLKQYPRQGCFASAAPAHTPLKMDVGSLARPLARSAR